MTAPAYRHQSAITGKYLFLIPSIIFSLDATMAAVAISGLSLAQ